MKRLQVRDLMRHSVVTVHPETDTAAARDLMTENDLRHLVVVDREGDLVGVVSHRDLLRHALIEQSGLPRYVERELLAQTKVRDVMVEPVMTAEPEQEVDDAARSFLDNKIGCLPVVEGRRVVGILTESDFVRWFAEGPRSAAAEEPEIGARLARTEAWTALAE
jgi:CBS domain-containing protein